MDVYSDILNNNKRISVIGLGYVGIFIATEFAKNIMLLVLMLTMIKSIITKMASTSQMKLEPKILKI